MWLVVHCSILLSHSCFSVLRARTLLLCLPFFITILTVNIIPLGGWLPWSIIVPAIKAVPGLVVAALLAIPFSSSRSFQPPSVAVLDVGVTLHCVVHCHRSDVPVRSRLSSWWFPDCQATAPDRLPIHFTFIISTRSSIRTSVIHLPLPLHLLHCPVSHFRLARCGCLQLRVPLPSSSSIVAAI